MKKTPICITGGSGFVGKNLVEHLLAAGYNAITVIDHNNPPKEFAGKIRFFRGDFDDLNILRKAIAPGSIIIHLAGTSNQATSEQNPIQDAKVSIIGTLTLLEQAARERIAKIVYLSSGPAVYGSAPKLPVETSALPHPRSAYGTMKLATEHYVRHYAEKHGFAYVILRSTNAYGPGQFATTHGVVSRFAYNILGKRPIEIWGSPDITRDFLYIDDLSGAIVSALKPRVKNLTLNVASGRGVTLGNLIQAIEKQSGLKATMIHKEQRFIDVPNLYFSIRETKKALGWVPKVSLSEGVKRTIKWIQDANL
jgi:UDP-glucose 4-epimerase